MEVFIDFPFNGITHKLRKKYKRLSLPQAIMKPIKLRKGNKGIILFHVTDVMGSQEGFYSYHIISETGEVLAYTPEQMKGYKFVGFVEDKEKP